jgi:two-component system, response regulator PdtaR
MLTMHAEPHDRPRAPSPRRVDRPRASSPTTPTDPFRGGVASPGPDALEAPDVHHPHKKLRVLIVEDEALVAIEIEDLLEELGVEVVGTAIDAEEALRLAETLLPDCLTMDIRLRGVRDGISVAIEIYRRLGIRSVFVTAHGDADTRARAMEANSIGWLAKPVTRERLAAALQMLRRDDADPTDEDDAKN